MKMCADTARPTRPQVRRLNRIIGAVAVLFAMLPVVDGSVEAQATSPAGLTYDTSFGEMTFSGADGGLQAPYNPTQNGLVFGELDGQIFVGEWGEDLSNVACESSGPTGTEYWGTLTFVFSDDFSGFTGEWGYCEGGTGGGSWSGTVVGGTSSSSTSSSTSSVPPPVDSAPEPEIEPADSTPAPEPDAPPVSDEPSVSTPVVEPDTPSVSAEPPEPAPVDSGFVVDEPEQPIDNCAISGTIVDVNGDPVPGVAVELRYRGIVGEATVTDDSGNYRFAETGTASGRQDVEFDPDEDPVSVRFELASAGGEYVIQHGDLDDVAVLVTAEAFLNEIQGCSINVTPRNMDPLLESVGGTTNLDDWGILLRTFRNIGRAMSYSQDELGIEWDAPGPLEVLAFCSIANGDACVAKTAAWTGPTLGYGRTGPSRISFSHNLLRRYKDGPTNVEYHEVGHHVMMEYFSNQMPVKLRPVPPEIVVENHGGLYKNESSNDALVEGFAEFFAAMVARDVDGVTKWTTYPVDGSSRYLERPSKIWNRGEEEIAFAGVLVDLVDGDADYPSFGPFDAAPGDWSVCVQPDCASDRIVVRVTNPFDVAFEDLFVDVFYSDGSADSAAVQPDDGTEVLRPGAAGTAFVPLPDGAASVGVQRIVVGKQNSDDDPIQVTPEEVFDAIEIAPFPYDPGYPHPVDVSQVYEALSFAFSGDRDADGMDDIDELFIRVGYYADTKGGASDYHYQDGEVIGASGYVDREVNSYVEGVRIGTETVSNPGRTALELRPVDRASFDVSGAAGVVALVEVLLPGDSERSYAYRTEPDDGEIAVVLPAQGEGARVRVSALADGFQQEFLDEIDVDAFWESVGDSADAPAPAFAGRMTTPSDDRLGSGNLLDPTGSGSSFPLLLILGVLGGAAALGAVVFVGRGRANTVAVEPIMPPGTALPIEGSITAPETPQPGASPAPQLNTPPPTVGGAGSPVEVPWYQQAADADSPGPIDDAVAPKEQPSWWTEE